MAYSFQVPRQRPRPLTQGAQLAEDQNTQGLATGNFADVQSARGATDRSNALRTSNALQATRGTFARSGVDTSPEAAARAQDQSFSAAEGQNLNGTNAVNQLQRQYRNDAVTNANQYEAAANQRQQQGVSNDQFDKTFGANREDAATARNQFGLNYNAGREDANTSKTQFGETMAQRKNEFGVSSGQSQQQIDNQSKQFLTSQAQRDKEFGVSSGQNQQQINNQASQFNQNYQAGREDAATSKNQFDLNRGDKNSQFNVTAAQSQQQIDNQAEQAAKKLGYDYNALSQNDKQFFQKMAQEDSQFQTKTNFDYNSLNQNLSENARQFDAKLGQEGSQFQSKLRQDENQFGVTSGMTQQQIDNQRNQFDKNYNQEGSQFDQTLAQNKSQFDLTRGDKQKSMTMDEINTIQDPVARNLALKAYYSGGDVNAAIGGNIGADGQLINKSMSPGTAAYQAKVDELQATYPNKSQAEIEHMVRDRAAKADALSQGVTDSGVKSILNSNAKDILSTNPSALTPDQKNALLSSGDIKSFEPGNMPTGGNAKSLIGKPVKLGGQFYTVANALTIRSGRTRSGDPRHTDTTILVDDQGNRKYFYNGTINDQQIRAV